MVSFIQYCLSKGQDKLWRKSQNFPWRKVISLDGMHDADVFFFLFIEYRYAMMMFSL
jgi:hypothetical protein